MTDEAPIAEEPPASRTTSIVVCLLIGIGAAVVGLLPWIATGVRLPLQNLWALQTMPDDMPLALLPFSNYYISTITALLVVGSAFAGIASRATAARRPRFGVTATLAGVLLVQAAAAVQATLVAHGGLESSSRASLYLAAIVAVIVVSGGVGILVLLLVAKAPRAGATIGLSLAALVATNWLGAFFAPLLLVDVQGMLTAAVLPVMRWLPAVLVGLAVAWGGFRTPGRIVAAVVSLAALWIGPAFFTAVGAAAGTRVLGHDPAGMVEYGIRVFGMAATMPELVLPPLVVAAVVGVVGGIAFDSWRARRAGAATAPQSADDAVAGARSTV